MQTIQNKFKDTIFIFLGDFQAQSTSTTQQTIGIDPITTPTHLIMNYLSNTNPPYASVIPTLHPNTPYITRWNRDSGRALDHIMIQTTTITKAPHAAIDHTYATRHIDTDHELIYADILTDIHPAQPPPNPPPAPPSYKILTSIPVSLPPDTDTTNPDNTWYIFNENTPQPPIPPGTIQKTP